MARKVVEGGWEEIDNDFSEDEDFGWNGVFIGEEWEENQTESVGEQKPSSHTDDLACSLSGLNSFFEDTVDYDEKSNKAGDPSSQKPIHRMALNDHKAGMQGLDKERINQVIFEASKGSKFYENEKKKEKRVKEKIRSFKERMQRFSELDYQRASVEAGKFVKQAKCERDLSRIVVHIDMDAFYAAVETRDNPSLKDIPMAVGSNYMLSTSNYVARKYGVRAAMPGFIAKKLCPNLKIVPLNFVKYREVSNRVRKVLEIYDPHFCGVGMDEAYLDLTDYLSNNHMKQDTAESLEGDLHIEKHSSIKQQLVEKTVSEIREKIFADTKLTASAGIACNVMLAKVCSDMNKPNGQYYLPPEKDAIMNFVTNLPIRKVSGIGRVSEQILNELGITKCGQLMEKKELLYLLFSEISFQHFMRISLGISSTTLDNESEQKSMSLETTFGEISDPEKLFRVCRDLCEGLSNDLQKKNLAGKSITVKFKLVNFEVRTRTKTILSYVNTASEIFNVAKEIIKLQMLACKPEKLNLRLLGVKVSEFGKKEKTAQNKLDAFLSKPRWAEMDKGTCDVNCTNIKSLVEKKRSDDSPCRLDVSECFAICPVCQMPQKESIINFHIDSCLNKQAIRDILSEDCRSDKPNEENAGGNARKRNRANEMVVDKRSKKKVTLQSFWGKT